MQALLTLLEHAEEDRNRALAAHQVASASQLAAQVQFEQLLEYRRDYEARWLTQFAEHGQMELVRSYHAFMIRLTQAVEHQQLALQQAGARLAPARSALRDRELRVASVRKLIERRRQRERAELARCEQKLNDERGWPRAQDSAFPSDMASMD